MLDFMHRARKTSFTYYKRLWSPRSNTEGNDKNTWYAQIGGSPFNEKVKIHSNPSRDLQKDLVLSEEWIQKLRESSWISHQDY